jgi:two-component system NtrC family sensor kinase
MPAQQGCIDCNLDSLAQHLQANISDTDRLFTLVELTNGIILPENPDSALHCVHDILSLNDRLNLIDPKPFLLIRDGLIFWKKKEGDSAINKFIQAITVFDEQKKIMGQYSLLTTIREFYNNLTLHEDRLKFYEEKLNYYQLNGPVENMAACYHGIAGFYYFNADYNQSIGYYLKSASVFKRFSRIGYGNEITVVGLMYSKWGNSERALFYLKIADSINNLSYFGREGNLELDKTEIAKISRQNRQFDQAFFYAREALNISLKFHHLENAAIEYAELGGIYLQMNKPDTALPFLRKARLLGDSVRLTIDGPRGPFECDFYWYQYYLQKNDLKNAETQLLIAYIKALRGNRTNWF